ncbi:MAG: ribosome small subunit-dependent GTPase A, partial [Gammaproteobacteria bacterium]
MNHLIEGLVLAHLGKGIAVESGDDIVLCQTRRRLDTVAVGDRVLWQASGTGQGRIEAILERRSLLTRPSGSDKIRPVAANIDTVYIVFAVEPACDFLLIDQYLAVCEIRTIEAALIFNKSDLNSFEPLERELEVYQALGYPLFRVSAINDIGLDYLKQTMKDHAGILTGQSGVGKSSLTNALIPDMALKTNSLSETTKHGRHTTTAATLYHLPEGGDLIDS